MLAALRKRMISEPAAPRASVSQAHFCGVDAWSLIIAKTSRHTTLMCAMSRVNKATGQAVALEREPWRMDVDGAPAAYFYASLFKNTWSDRRLIMDGITISIGEPSYMHPAIMLCGLIERFENLHVNGSDMFGNLLLRIEHVSSVGKQVFCPLAKDGFDCSKIVSLSLDMISDVDVSMLLALETLSVGKFGGSVYADMANPFMHMKTGLVRLRVPSSLRKLTLDSGQMCGFLSTEPSDTCKRQFNIGMVCDIKLSDVRCLPTVNTSEPLRFIGSSLKAAELVRCDIKRMPRDLFPRTLECLTLDRCDQLISVDISWFDNLQHLKISRCFRLDLSSLFRWLEASDDGSRKPLHTLTIETDPDGADHYTSANIQQTQQSAFSRSYAPTQNMVALHGLTVLRKFDEAQLIQLAMNVNVIGLLLNYQYSDAPVSLIGRCRVPCGRRLSIKSCRRILKRETWQEEPQASEEIDSLITTDGFGAMRTEWTRPSTHAASRKKKSSRMWPHRKRNSESTVVFWAADEQDWFADAPVHDGSVYDS